MKRLSMLLWSIAFIMFPLLINGGAKATQPSLYDVFTQVNSDGGKITEIVQTVFWNDAIYIYFDNGNMYRWPLNQEKAELFCTLPQMVSAYVAKNEGYLSLDEETQRALGETISHVAIGEHFLWGWNVFSGNVGEIDSSGIHWTHTPIDVSTLLQENDLWPMRIVHAFVQNDTLHALIALDNTDYPDNNYNWFSSSLLTGESRMIKLPKIKGSCQYIDGKVLLLQHDDDTAWSFCEMNLATHEIRPLELQVPSHTQMGGLAYLSSPDVIAFIADGQLWTSESGKAFMPVSPISIPDIVGEIPAGISSQGIYFIEDGEFYFEDIFAEPASYRRLSLKGVMQDQAYERFVADNPEVVVTLDYEAALSENIAQIIASGDTNTDIYEVIVDNTFEELKGKGFAALLNQSDILTSDVKRMYPAVQCVLSDKKGNPVAYPITFSLGNWSIHHGYWEFVFGNLPPPETYEEFIDAMLLWELEYADEFPEIDFLMNFDHEYLVTTLINTYAQIYGRQDKPLDLANSCLPTLLQKLDRVVQIRSQKGKHVKFITDDELYLMKPWIIHDFGFSAPLLDWSIEYSVSESSLVYGINPENFSLLDPLVFYDGEEPLCHGKLYVRFINPNTKNFDLALKYLEYSADKDSDPRTYISLHPNENEPILWPSFLQEEKAKETKKSELAEMLKTAEGENKKAIEDELASLDRWFAFAETEKWRVSPNAIEEYRKIAPSIRFFEDSIYVAPSGSKLEEQLKGVYGQYVSGKMDRSIFLKTLDQKMQMIYAENKI